jgi:hypothetical protein
MNDKTRDALTRWWWPGQWLRIVYGMCVDQVWYWQNVRPRLGNWPEGRKVLIQALLGNAVVTVLLSIILGTALLVAGVHLNWGVGFLGMIAWLIAVAVGLVVIPTRGAQKIDYVVVSGTFVSLLGGLGFGLRFGSMGMQETWFGLPGSLGLGIVLGLLAGICDGVRLGIVEGRRLAAVKDLALGFFLAFALVMFVALDAFVYPSVAALLGTLVLAILSVIPGGYLGSRWATRQVAEESLRMRLANPDSTSAGTRAE